MSIKANIVIEKGTTFELIFALHDENGDTIDLTGFTPSAALKRWYTSTTAYPLTTSANVANSSVSLSLTAAQSNSIPAGRYVYDVSLADDHGEVTRVVEGIATVTPNVTGS